MKLSVLINNYNYARFLPETLGSVVAQSIPPHEIIVVDDGSADNSLEVLEKMRATIPNLVVQSQSNGGQLSAMRKGIELASGDWYAFLDADDTWEPDHLAGLLDALQKDNQIGAYYTGHRETQGPPIYRSKWPGGAVGPVAALVALTGVRIGTITSTLMLRRDFAMVVATMPSNFDDDWRTRADDCLIFGCCLAGAIVYHNPSQSVNYRIHGQNMFAGDVQAAYHVYIYNLRKARMMCFYRNRFGLETHILPKLLPTEYLRHYRNQSSARSRKVFLKAIFRSEIPTLKKLKILAKNILKIGSFPDNFHKG